FVYPPKEPMPAPRNNAYVQTAVASTAPVSIEKASKTGNIKVDNDMPIAAPAPAVADQIPATPEAALITTPNTDSYITKPQSEEQATTPQVQQQVATEETKPAVPEEAAKVPATEVPAAAIVNTSTPPAATTEVSKPTELGETPLLKDDGQPAKAEVAVKEAPAAETVKEETPAAPQAPVAETTVLTEEKRPDVASAPVAKEETPAPVEAPKAATEAPVVTAIAPVVKEEINTPAPEPAKATQPVHIDALNNDVAQKPADATVVASISAPAAVVAETPTAKQDAAPEEPQDEFSRLKARLDKVVYAKNDKGTTSAPTVATTPVTPAPEAKPVKETPPAETAKINASDAAKFYTVKKGDTAFNIAKRNNITMRQLLNWNNLDFETVKVGQRLRVKE
ncbi:MAG: LysM peptidoglycan-binding domain-containing protein, partial [Bacteroidetes bacterium]|nr:LysM peptidoglycan-binding domain-containing protein [Bacteroidota bacterium]